MLEICAMVCTLTGCFKSQLLDLLSGKCTHVTEHVQHRQEVNSLHLVFKLAQIWESLSQHVLQSKCLCVCVITVCHFVCLSVTESLCVRKCLPCVVAVCTAFSVTSRNH